MDTQESQDHQPTNRVSRLLEWILGVNLLILVSLLAFALRSPYRQVDRGWEYKIEEISDSGFTDRMNVLGRQGWEMVGLSILPAIPANESQENLFLVVFRKSEYYVPSKTIESPSDN